MTNPDDVVQVFVEIPKGSRNKYEWDHHTRQFILDRMLFSAVHYPGDYGFIRDTFGRVDAKVPRVLVTHHPIFSLPTDEGLGKPIKNQADVLEMIGSLGVDLLLAGHNHRASHQDSADFVTKSTGALVIQAGTTTSTRFCSRYL